VRNVNGTADVCAEDVIAQLGLGSMLAGVVVKIVVRVESIVAIESPGFAVELRCAALEDMVMVPPEAMP